MRLRRICKICKKKFTAKQSDVLRGRGVCCSLKCKHEWQSKKLTKPKHRIVCPICKKVFFVRNAEKNIRVTCSKDCLAKHLSLHFRKSVASRWLGGDVVVKCKNCGKLFVSKRHDAVNRNRKYCSLSCSNIGQNNPQWRGGASSGYAKQLATRGWDNLRKKVYQRDKYVCKRCGAKSLRGNGVVLHAHHIIPWRISKDDSFDNLTTLCAKCHRKEEMKYYKNLRGSVWERENKKN